MESHPPFFTLQLSINTMSRPNEYIVLFHSIDFLCVLTCANDIGIRTSIGVSSFAGTFDCIGFRMMRANCIDITTTIFNQTTIYKYIGMNSKSQVARANQLRSIINRQLLTCASDIGFRGSVGVACFATTFHCIRRRIMKALSIDITSTIAHKTTIYKHPMICNYSFHCSHLINEYEFYLCK